MRPCSNNMPSRLFLHTFLSFLAPGGTILPIPTLLRPLRSPLPPHPCTVVLPLAQLFSTAPLPPILLPPSDDVIIQAIFVLLPNPTKDFVLILYICSPSSPTVMYPTGAPRLATAWGLDVFALSFSVYRYPLARSNTPPPQEPLCSLKLASTPEYGRTCL